MHKQTRKFQLCVVMEKGIPNHKKIPVWIESIDVEFTKEHREERRNR